MPQRDSPRHAFPTRQYSYQKHRGLATPTAAFSEGVPTLEAGGVYRFILGRDAQPQRLSLEQVRTTLHDPFASLILGRGKSPVTLRTLLEALDQVNGEVDGLADQRSFVVADGGQIAWTPDTADLNRQLRFVVVRGQTGHIPVLFVSTSTAVDSPSTFLQVIGWDPENRAYQFYDRRMGAWVWAGSSWDALAPDSRGNGPFDSHVNGALNMKELKQPWINWHSQAAAIQESVLAPDDPLRSEPLWGHRQPAEAFEIDVVRPGIRRWTQARFERCLNNGQLTRLPEFFRQILETTTINLITAPEESRQLQLGKPLHLPLTFFINADALLNVLELAPDITRPEVDGGIYLACLQRFNVTLTNGIHRFPGDTHFAFLVPEPAFEDLTILERLLEMGILTQKLAACLFMVDFYNPVFSQRRAALLRYVPDAATTGVNSSFTATFIGAIEAEAESLVANTPEHEFLANWRLPEAMWRSEFETRIKGFFDALQLMMTNVDRFVPIFQLAESRRREFRQRPLAEFRLTTPVTNIPEDAPFLEFTSDAQIRPKV